MESWKRYCPDYEIRAWEDRNFPLGESLYARQSYQSRKWAFVSDYIRLWALWEMGGVYLDTDVELLTSLDDFLELDGFCGFESPDRVATCILGFPSRHPLIGEFLELYRNIPFVGADGNLDCTTNVARLTGLLIEKGLQLSGKKQTVAGVTVYPQDYFSPKDLATGRITVTERTRAIHHFRASWMTSRQRFHTCMAQWLGPDITQRLKRWKKKNMDGASGTET